MIARVSVIYCFLKQTQQEQSENVKNRHTRLGAALHAERDRTHETSPTGTDSAVTNNSGFYGMD